MIRRISLAALACAAHVHFTQTAPDPRPEIHAYLAKHAFTAEEIAALESGDAVARATLANANEIATVAAVKVRAPRGRVLDYYGQMISYVDGEVTLAFGTFSTPAAAADVKDLAFDSGEVGELRACRPGKCDVRIGGAGIESLHTSVDWRAADAVARVNDFARKAAVAYVTAYRDRGDAALITYDDRATPVHLRGEWQGILGNAAYFHEYAPELKAYLQQYPRGTLPGARDVVYWVKENYGLKPVISIVHGVIYQPPARADRAFVVQKHIYASHYYDGSLAIATLLSAPDNSTYLVYANRSRGDLLRGGFGGLKRTMAQSQARKSAVHTLGTIKRQLEQ